MNIEDRRFARCHYEEVSPRYVAPAERFEAWGHAMRVRSGSVVERGERDRARPFDGSLRRLTGRDGSRFSDIRAPAFTLRRANRAPPEHSHAVVQLALVLDGSIVADSGAGGPVQIGPGEMRVVDLSPPFESRWHGRQLRLTLPRAAVVAALGGEPGRVHGMTVPHRRLAPMLADQLRALAALAEHFDEAACALALRATAELAVMALELEFGRVSDPEQTAAGLFAAACRLIERSLSSPGLTPARIAARLGCSRAQLYRVFARHDLAVADYIREQRLQRCRAALGAARDETIADLAFAAGFENPVHFARLFKARFGMSPREARRLSP